MIKQRRLLVTNIATVLVEASPTRKSLILQNNDENETFMLFNPKENENVGIHITPHSWIQLDKDDDADKKWWIGSTLVAGAYIQVTEIYEEKAPIKPWWSW